MCHPLGAAFENRQTQSFCIIRTRNVKHDMIIFTERSILITNDFLQCMMAKIMFPNLGCRPTVLLWRTHINKWFPSRVPEIPSVPLNTLKRGARSKRQNESMEIIFYNSANILTRNKCAKITRRPNFMIF